MNERALEARVYDWLITEKSYPKDELQLEAAIDTGKQGRTYRADLAVLDSRRSEFISLIEVKRVREHKALRDAVAQLLHYRRILGKPHIPIYLFFPPIEGTKKSFEIAQVLSDGDTKEVFPNEFPSYDALVSRDKAGKKATRGTAVRSAVDTFQITCVGLSILVAIVLGLDVAGVLQLSSKQLLLGGIAAALLLLPYAAKFKMLGVEFERHVPKKDEADRPN